MYYIYHIPGKKIGVTRDLNRRVTVTQGYKKGEYEVLDSSVDIDYVSRKELELQFLYGYKVDRKLYKNLFNKNPNPMLPRATEATTTFPCPLNKLKGRLMDLKGLSWQTPDGLEFEITDTNIPWILSNANVSMYDKDRCYIYNKAFHEAFLDDQTPVNIYDNIRDWATEKGIYKSGDARTQYIKLMEEAGELAQAILKNDEPEVIDAIGDMVVVLTNLAKLRGHNIEDCIESAYNVIKFRQGNMVNGTFVKQQSFPSGTTDHWKKVTL
jgi:NTP pyrophosphatase (non-canonical NTP hydrolase)